MVSRSDDLGNTTSNTHDVLNRVVSMVDENNTTHTLEHDALDRLVARSPATDPAKLIAAGNLIVRNSASGNGVNWVIAADNQVGEIISAPNSVAISGSTGGAGVGSEPWANFSF